MEASSEYLCTGCSYLSTYLLQIFVYRLQLFVYLLQLFVSKLHLMRVGAGVTPVSRCEQALNIEQLSPGALSSFVSSHDCWPWTLPCLL